jgi:hypothetical protein
MKGTWTRIRFNAYSLCICDEECEDDCHSAKHRLREGLPISPWLISNPGV